MDQKLYTLELLNLLQIDRAILLRILNLLNSHELMYFKKKKL